MEFRAVQRPSLLAVQYKAAAGTLVQREEWPDRRAPRSPPYLGMAVVAAQLAFAQCLFDGCIASFDAEKQRRPYHRNCGCALHGCGPTGTRDVSCCCANLPCPLRPGACSRGRLAVASPASSLSSTGGSRSRVGVGAMHGEWAFGSEEGLRGSPRLQTA